MPRRTTTKSRRAASPTFVAPMLCKEVRELPAPGDWLYEVKRDGCRAIAIKDGAVHHTYSTYARGLDGLWGAFQWLDRAPLGRNETGIWWKRHDEYAVPGTAARS